MLAMNRKTSSTIRPILSFLAYVGAAFLVAYFLIERHPPTLPVGSLAPVDERVSLLSGGKTSLRKYLRKPLVLNVWAAFCPACMREMPVLSKLATQFRSKVTFLGAAFATPVDEIEAVKRKFLLDYEQVRVTDDFVDVWHARALPTTYVIDRQGSIVWAHVGIISEQELEEVLLGVLKP